MTKQEISVKEFVRRMKISITKNLNSIAKKRGYSDYKCYKAMVINNKMKCKECRTEIGIEYQTIKCRRLKKEFRIYKWEDKPIKDFKIPKGFDFAEHLDLIYLYDADLFEIEKYPVEYFVKNHSKKNIEKGWEISRLFLDWYSLLDSRGEYLAYSDDYGRVVVSRSLK